MKLRFFGRLREIAEGGECAVDLPAQITSTEALRAWLGQDHPQLLDRSIRIALDDRFATGDEPIAGAAEIAFLPPVSGG